MDEAAFADAMKELEQHSEAIEILLIEIRERGSHPMMERLVPFWTAVASDLEHHGVRLIAAAREIYDGYDRRKH